jgi:hypothetical protein
MKIQVTTVPCPTAGSIAWEAITSLYSLENVRYNSICYCNEKLAVARENVLAALKETKKGE